PGQSRRQSLHRQAVLLRQRAVGFAGRLIALRVQNAFGADGQLDAVEAGGLRLGHRLLDRPRVCQTSLDRPVADAEFHDELSNPKCLARKAYATGPLMRWRPSK